MKVKELIESLKTHDQEAEVIMSIDPEGNGFGQLYQIEVGIYKNGEFEQNCVNKHWTKVICLFP